MSNLKLERDQQSMKNNLLEKCIKALDPRRNKKEKRNNGYVCVFETLMMCLVAEKTNEKARKI